MDYHVALMFPGRRYGPAMPVLRYPAQALRQAGADVGIVDYPEVLTSAEVPTAMQWNEAMRVITGSVAERIAGASRVTLLA